TPESEAHCAASTVVHDPSPRQHAPGCGHEVQVLASPRYVPALRRQAMGSRTRQEPSAKQHPPVGVGPARVKRYQRISKGPGLTAGTASVPAALVMVKRMSWPCEVLEFIAGPGKSRTVPLWYRSSGGEARLVARL